MTPQSVYPEYSVTGVFDAHTLNTHNFHQCEIMLLSYYLLQEVTENEFIAFMFRTKEMVFFKTDTYSNLQSFKSLVSLDYTHFLQCL